MVRQALIGIIVILGNGEVRVVSDSVALAHLDQQAYVQALAIPALPPPVNYRQITQSRQCNTTLDNAREAAQLGR